MAGVREGSLEAPTRHALNWTNPEFYDEDKLFAELERVYDICHGCRRCVSLCQSFPVLFDLVDRLTRHRDHQDRQAREVVTGAVNLGRKYLFDEEHARHVAALALAIFDQTRSLHGLEDHDRKILHAAALLHDIGQFVSYKGHHKHSLYLITHSELPNFTSSEMMLVANVARYHRKSHPKPEHADFVRLSETDRDSVSALAGMLRVAVALDRTHAGAVRSLECQLDEEGAVTVRLRAASGQPPTLEIFTANQRKGLLERGLKLKVRFEVGG